MSAIAPSLPMAPALRRTICNTRWLLLNSERLQQCFPEQWTPLPDIDAVAIGEQLRKVGVDWSGAAELAGVMVTLQTVGIMRLAVGRAPFGTHDIELVRRGPLVVVT